jgi:hypothetical protein
VNRTRTILAVLAPLGAIAALVGLSACPANPAPTLYTPITGVIIDSEGLTAGVGCGTADDQVFEYAAVASLAPDAAAGVSGLPVSGVFPCYANGQLANLPSPDGGTFDYVIKIYAWNQASFPAAELGGCDDLPADASCQGENPATVLKYAPTADWTTTCTVTQVVGVSEVATCGALVRNLDASLGADTGTEAGVGDGSTDGPGEAGETGEAGGVEGGMPTDSGAADGADGGGSPITDGGDGG